MPIKLLLIDWYIVTNFYIQKSWDRIIRLSRMRWHNDDYFYVNNQYNTNNIFVGLIKVKKRKKEKKNSRYWQLLHLAAKISMYQSAVRTDIYNNDSATNWVKYECKDLESWKLNKTWLKSKCTPTTNKLKINK